MSDNRSKHVEDRLLDRLVDGELSAGERRNALQALTTQPDGWRRCALAFMEAQVLREALDENWCETYATHEHRHSYAAGPNACGQSAPRAGVSPFRSTPQWIPLGVAASVLLAFVAGYATREFRPASTLPATSQIADSTSNSDLKASNVNPEGLPAEPWDNLRLVNTSNGIPAAATFLDTASPEEYWQTASAVPSDVRLHLQRLGVDVRQRRGFVPVRMHDGRQFVVPYEDVHIVPVNGPAN